MIYIGVGKSYEHVVCIVLKLVAGKIEGWDYLLKHAPSDVLTHDFVLHTGSDGVKSRKKSVRHQRGMSSVEYPYLSGPVHFKLVTGDDNVESCLGEGELALNIVFRFNYPKMEVFGGVDHVVLIAKIKLLPLGEARVYTVNKCVAKYNFIFYPSLKLIAVIPKLSIGKNAFFQVVAVAVDKLAGEHDKSA